MTRPRNLQPLKADCPFKPNQRFTQPGLCNLLIYTAQAVFFGLLRQKNLSTSLLICISFDFQFFNLEKKCFMQRSAIYAAPNQDKQKSQNHKIMFTRSQNQKSKIKPR